MKKVQPGLDAIMERPDFTTAAGIAAFVERTKYDYHYYDRFRDAYFEAEKSPEFRAIVKQQAEESKARAAAAAPDPPSAYAAIDVLGYIKNKDGVRDAALAEADVARKKSS